MDAMQHLQGEMLIALLNASVRTFYMFFFQIFFRRNRFTVTNVSFVDNFDRINQRSIKVYIITSVKANSCFSFLLFNRVAEVSAVSSVSFGSGNNRTSSEIGKSDENEYIFCLSGMSINLA